MAFAGYGLMAKPFSKGCQRRRLVALLWRQTSSCEAAVPTSLDSENIANQQRTAATTNGHRPDFISQRQTVTYGPMGEIDPSALKAWQSRCRFLKSSGHSCQASAMPRALIGSTETLGRRSAVSA